MFFLKLHESENQDLYCFLPDCQVYAIFEKLNQKFFIQPFKMPYLSYLNLMKIFLGISGGANVVAAIEVANLPEMEGKLIVTSIASFGERYLSSPLYSDIREEATALKEQTLEDAMKRINIH